ncbi:MAG: hypothetical protein ACR2JF_00615 [Iamia sp.]
MTDPTPTDGTEGFAARVQQLHVPEPKADREALLLKVGAGLAVLGVVLIFVAWFQASGTDSVAEQVPFAISGGLIGLALVIFGSALVIRYSLARLFRFWLARMLYEHQVQTDRTVEALGRIEAVLGGQSPRAPADHSGARPTASTDSVTAADR